MKSIRLNDRSRQDILDSIKEEFKINFYKANNLSLDKTFLTLKREQKEIISGHIYFDIYGNIKFPKQVKPFLHYGGTLKIQSESGRVESVNTSNPIEQTNRILKIYSDSIFLTMFSEYDNLVKLKHKFDTQNTRLYSESNQIISSVTSTKQLLELWPSVEKYLPAYLSNPEKAINLPTIAISRIDERIKGMYE